MFLGFLVHTNQGTLNSLQEKVTLTKALHSFNSETLKIFLLKLVKPRKMWRVESEPLPEFYFPSKTLKQNLKVSNKVSSFSVRKKLAG